MIESLVREHLRRFSPYKSARSDVHAATIFLDANELSIGSPVSFGDLPLNRYPDPHQTLLRRELARMASVAPERLFAGVGSDEIIDLLIRLFCDPGKDEVAILEPTYGVYRVAADLNAVEVRAVALDDRFGIDVERTRAAVAGGVKLLFCCSPNNPTGNLLDKNDILALCREFRGIVVVDEAYVEFAPPGSTLAGEGPANLVVLRTLSKAWGLAGIRLGYCIADPVVVSYLLRIKSPYNLNAVTMDLALRALRERSFSDDTRAAVAVERIRLASALASHRSVRHVHPSEANFLLVSWLDAAKAYDLLYKKGIVVRKRSEPRLRDCLRITVGTPEENAALLAALKELA